MKQRAYVFDQIEDPIVIPKLSPCKANTFCGGKRPESVLRLSDNARSQPVYVARSKRAKRQGVEHQVNQKSLRVIANLEGTENQVVELVFGCLRNRIRGGVHLTRRLAQTSRHDEIRHLLHTEQRHGPRVT